MARSGRLKMGAIVTATAIGCGLIVANVVAPIEKNPLATQAAEGALTLTGASILGSGCTSQVSKISWFGGPYPNMTSPPALAEDAPKGKVYVCWTKYRISDKDTKADYYGALAESYWTLSSGRTNGNAVANQSIKSTVAATGSVYGATSGFTSSRACTVNIPLSLSVSIFSADVPVRVCSGYKVTRTSYGTAGASWSTKNGGALRVLRTIYAQKVPAGKVPRFTLTFAIPQYTKRWNSGYQRTEWSSHLVYQTFSGK